MEFKQILLRDFVLQKFCQVVVRTTDNKDFNRSFVFKSKEDTFAAGAILFNENGDAFYKRYEPQYAFYHENVVLSGQNNSLVKIFDEISYKLRQELNSSFEVKNQLIENHVLLLEFINDVCEGVDSDSIPDIPNYWHNYKSLKYATKLPFCTVDQDSFEIIGIV